MRSRICLVKISLIDQEVQPCVRLNSFNCKRQPVTRIRYEAELSYTVLFWYVWYCGFIIVSNLSTSEGISTIFHNTSSCTSLGHLTNFKQFKAGIRNEDGLEDSRNFSLGKSKRGSVYSLVSSRRSDPEQEKTCALYVSRVRGIVGEKVKQNDWGMASMYFFHGFGTKKPMRRATWNRYV